jgi:hypothetical protein
MSLMHRLVARRKEYALLAARNAGWHSCIISGGEMGWQDNCYEAVRYLCSVDPQQWHGFGLAASQRGTKLYFLGGWDAGLAYDARHEIIERVRLLQNERGCIAYSMNINGAFKVKEL